MLKKTENQDNALNPIFLHKWIEDTVKKFPNHIAAVYNEEQHSYHSLNKKADKLAGQIIHKWPLESIIGVSCTKSLDLIVFLLAILKAGKSYLPLDANYPKNRLIQTIDDSKIIAFLSEPEEFDYFKSFGLTPVKENDHVIDIGAVLIKQEPNACVLYTSGSTGKPKGVCLTHANLCMFLEWQQYNSYSANNLRTLQFCHLGFDGSIMEIFLSLICGGTIYLINDDIRLDALKLIEFVALNKINKISVPYVSLQYLTDAAVENGIFPTELKDINCGGEIMKITPNIRTFFDAIPTAQLFNVYGPTETTHSVARLVLQAPTSAWPDLPTIGKPIANATIYFLDEDLRLLPDGEVGELCISGPGLADGYLHQPELTEEKFINWEHPTIGKIKIYRTGDLGKFLPDGTIDFLGRKDGQVKIRGNRVELSEIEIAFVKLGGVSQVVAKVIESTPGNKSLIAYFTGSSPISPEELRKYISNLLPDYMVPDHYIWLDAMPKNASGKLDKSALPAPTYKRFETDVLYKKPRTTLEIEIALIFKNILRYDEIGLDDNFFEFGGNSLLAQKAVAALRTQLARQLPITKLYQFSTVAKIADYFKKNTIDTKQKPLNRTIANHTNEVAVIGMAGRFPGANTIDKFWENLLEGKETTSFFSDEELDESISLEVKNDPTYVKARGIIENANQFEPSFFNLNPKLAELMDPQQRIFLEIAYEVLEKTGHLPQNHHYKIGVFAGAGTNTYYEKNVLAHPELIENQGKNQVISVNDKDYIASRTAYHLNLKGPAVNVNSACSTSLLAIAQAANNIRTGICQVAIAGAASITSPIKSGHIYQEGSMLSSDGHCKPFDDTATGTVFSDGAGVVLLKNLEAAERDGDTIYAVIKGIGINNDGGNKGSFTAPTTEGQADAISDAVKDAGISASEISYVEGHGTGTPIGDPIEVEGLIEAFGNQERKQFCALGSIKSNFGHLTHAAGVAGFIKTCLALHTHKIPATLGFKTPNRNTDFKNSPFYVNSELIEWKQEEKRYAGVTSLGVGGTNVHVVLEEYENIEKPTSNSKLPEIVMWSAKSEESANRYGENLASCATSQLDLNLTNISWSLNKSRTDFSFRKFVVARNEADFLAQVADKKSKTYQLKTSPTNLVFVFPGQGAQYLNMAKELYDREAVFKEHIDLCAELLLQYIEEDIRQIIFPTEKNEQAEQKLKNTKYTQPALFVTEYALAKLWMSWGLVPTEFCGHSIGEYVAAHLAGVFSLEDGIKLIALRGKMVSELPGGSMLSVRGLIKEIAPIIPKDIDIAAINSPRLFVLSGKDEVISDFAKKLTEREIANSLLFTSHAFHSSMMDPIIADFELIAKEVKLSAPHTPIISTVTGTYLTNDEATNPKYWANHLRKTVRFADAASFMLKEFSAPIFLEVGPGTVTTTFINQTAAAENSQTKSIASLADKENNYVSLLNSLGQLWAAGQPINWDNYFQNNHKKFLNLPTYQFNRQLCWVNPEPKTSLNKTIQPLTTSASVNQQVQLKSNANMRKNALTAQVKQILEDASGVEMQDVNVDLSFLEIGLDSLLLTQIAISLKRKFELPITFRKLNEEYPSVGSLVDYIDKNSAQQFVDSSATVNRPVSQTSANLLPLNGSAVDGSLSLIAQQIDLLARQVQLLQGGAAQKIASAPVTSFVAAQPSISSNSTELSEKEKTEIAKPFGATPKIDRKVTQLSEKQVAFLENLTERYNKKTAKSKAYASNSRPFMADPRVVSGFKPLTKELVYPIVMNKSAGSKMWDLDGNEYIDALNGFGSNMLGYQPDVIKEALHAQVENGFEVGPQHELAADVCRLVCEFTNFDRSALCSTGSEAVLGCIRIARTVTARSLIVAFTGSYHGIIDEVLVRGTKKLKSFPAAAGIMPEAVSNILVLDYGTEESLQIIKDRANEIAAVLVEPIQSRRPEFVPTEFLHKLREVTTKCGAALVFDEVITGFRMHPGGAQALMGIKADIASYGKVVGAGLPIGVIAGKKEYMDALDGGDWNYGDHSIPEIGVTYFAGTFVRHPLALAAAKASLLYMKKMGPSLQKSLNEKGKLIADTLNGEISKRGLPLTITNYGSIWRSRFDEDIPYSELMFTLMREKGIHILDGFPCFVTEAMNADDIQKLIKTYVESLDEMIKIGFFPKANKDAYIADGIVVDGNNPPIDGAKLGKDKNGNPAWFLESKETSGKFVQLDVI
ncbi:amino acid adenylation domain-containing protein [Pedobacter sp. UYP30]|uniref:amino acid adenylation domain-containing protein n=1 Tax=Pedobacter sp. UYP30 TaxID=1756400 RepID=UPI00339384D7